MIKKLAYVLLALFTMVTLSISVYANENYKEEFIKGTNGEISTIINKRAFKKADEAILINENASIDAISVTPLAYLKKAPIITTSYKNINQDTIDYLKDLGVKKVTIIGGLKSISKTIENKIQGMEIEVERIYGNDRYETAIKVSQERFNNGEASSVILVGKDAVVDGLAAAPLAISENAPILFADVDSLNPQTQQEIIRVLGQNFNQKTVYIVGGESKISKNVELMLAQTGVKVERLHG